jgi:chromosome segregation ATPase
MASEPENPETFTAAQRAGLDVRSIDQDRTLVAIQQLEAALTAAGPGRETPWRRDVLAALGALDEATRDEEINAQRSDSLLSDIKRSQPRLRSRVNGVRAQYRHLRQALTSLQEELQNADDAATGTDIADIRQRLSWLLTALRHQRARETDLIYDAYQQAFDSTHPNNDDES